MASSRNTLVARGKQAPVKPAPKPWAIADDKASTSYVDRILGIRGNGAADVAGRHAKDTLASTVQTLRGYNERYGFCTENELAHMWYLDQVAGVDQETRKKLDAIMKESRFKPQQRIESAYAAVEKTLSPEEKKKMLQDKVQIDGKFSRRATVPQDATVGQGKEKKLHQKIIKTCGNKYNNHGCIPMSNTVPYKIADADSINKELGTQIDLEFIAEHENGADKRSASVGYVPWEKGDYKGNNSGVTIGTGFDLGQNNAADLVRLGIPQDSALFKKLAPYLGLKKEAACNKLAADILAGQALTLTEDEVNELNKLVQKREFRTLKRRWDAGVQSGGKKFADLDSRQQTALASLSYQKGSNWVIKNKEQELLAFRTAALKGDWEAAQNEFEAVYSMHNSRRKAERDLLSEALQDIKKAQEKAAQ